jgi:hypothetical protein
MPMTSPCPAERLIQGLAMVVPAAASLVRTEQVRSCPGAVFGSREGAMYQG